MMFQLTCKTQVLLNGETKISWNAQYRDVDEVWHDLGRVDGKINEDVEQYWDSRIIAEHICRDFLEQNKLPEPTYQTFPYEPK